MNDVDQVVALIEDFVNFGTRCTEIGSECMSDGVLHNLWVWLVTDTEYIVPGNHVIEA